MVGAMLFSAIRWLPYLKTSSDTKIVYEVHQYEPQDDYTHHESDVTNG